MGNALLFTACLLGAAVLGGFVGNCCAKGRRDDGDHGRRLADLEDRLDALADHCMEEGQRLRERVSECELLIGETPEDGLLGRVGNLEEARRREDLLGQINMLNDDVNFLIAEVEEIKKRKAKNG